MQTGQIANDGGYLRIRVIDRDGNLNTILDQTDDDLDYQCDKLLISVLRDVNRVVIGFVDRVNGVVVWKENES